ncbi:MAG: type 1 pili tip component [Chromatiales bacterium]|nr:type 1 pili tip component [Chromatiales bacterium]
MRVRELLNQWQRSGEQEIQDQAFTVRLTRHEKAKIAALADMFPGRSETDIVLDLLRAALSELEAGMPYVPGPRVVSEDEQGDPLYEDIGPMPRYRELTRKHLEGQD